MWASDSDDDDVPLAARVQPPPQEVYTAEQRAHDRRPLSPGFRGTNKQTRDGGGLPEGEEGVEGGLPSGITHDLVLKFDLPARRMEREERLLAMHGGDVNATLRDICVEGGGKDARFLLAHGADANYRGAYWAVLELAASNGHLTVVEALLDAGAGELNRALWEAAARGHTAIAALLLDRGADIHHDRVWALWITSRYGRLETATLLLDRGADPNAHPPGHATALKTARDRGHHEVAALLLARGAIA